METVIDRPPPTGEGLTFEKVWAMFQETDRKFQETREQMKETDRKMQETDKKIGKLGNRFGELVEHLVAPNIEGKFNELGFVFSRTSTNIKLKKPEKPMADAEIDILLENGDVVMAVEVKAHPVHDDVKDHVKRMKVLRLYADEKQDKRRYQGAIAGAVLTDSVRRYILKQGFYLIEQTGDTVQISIPEGFMPRDW